MCDFYVLFPAGSLGAALPYYDFTRPNLGSRIECVRAPGAFAYVKRLPLPHPLTY